MDHSQSGHSSETQRQDATYHVPMEWRPGACVQLLDESYGRPGRVQADHDRGEG